MIHAASTPVLLIMFSREAFARRLVDVLREVRPARVYLAADAPRHHVSGEAVRCAATWEAVHAAIDWPCELQTFRATENIGPARFIPQAIDWLFSFEERAIILEEDCIPHPDFFRFCGELLERYAADERVAMISGCQFVRNGWPCGGASYAFVHVSQIWGWATWRRAWRNYDLEMRAWPEERQRGMINRLFSESHDRRIWTKNFDEALDIDSWDFQWCFTRWRLGQAGIVPNRNLVSNIGFGPDAIHTKHANHPSANVPCHPMDFPLRHPESLVFDDELDRQTTPLLFPKSKKREALEFCLHRLRRWRDALLHRRA